MKVKKITKPELNGDTYLIAQAVNHIAELLEDLLDRIDKLEKVKPCKEGQLNELGYSLGEKIDPCEKRNIDAYVAFREKALEYTFSKAIAEVDRQEKWLAEAGYNVYNVSIAFGAIKRALQK